MFRFIYDNLSVPTNKIASYSEASEAAVYYHIAAMYNIDNQSDLESVTDLLGICSRDNLGCKAIAEYGYNQYHKASGRYLRDIRKGSYFCHKPGYSITKANTEAWAELNAAELCGDESVSKTNRLYLSNTVKEVHSLFEIILNLHVANKLTWRY